jgi:hypothetical protein
MTELDCEELKERIERLQGMLTKSMAATKSAEERADALAVENQALKKFFKNAAFDADYESELCMERGGFTDALNNIETPATAAALAAIQAQGVERLINLKMEQLANMHPDTHAFGATAESLRTQINELQAFADELREAK